MSLSAPPFPWTLPLLPGSFPVHPAHSQGSFYTTSLNWLLHYFKLFCALTPPPPHTPCSQEAVVGPQPATVAAQNLEASLSSPTYPYSSSLADRWQLGPPSPISAHHPNSSSATSTPGQTRLPSLLWASGPSTRDPPSSLPADHESSMTLSQVPPGWSALGKSASSTLLCASDPTIPAK